MCEELAVCDGLPAVLCHGDLSLKNIIINQEEITLIDWDDAYSLCCLDDVARLTLWMSLNYGKSMAAGFRNAFLEHYESECDGRLFEKVESILHIWHGIDGMNYFFGKPQYDRLKEIVRESLARNGMTGIYAL